MHGICFDYELQSGLNSKSRLKFPETISSTPWKYDFNIKSAAKIVWLGGKPSVEYTKSKRKLLGYDELDFP
jgi:hypothetical protein